MCPGTGGDVVLVLMIKVVLTIEIEKTVWVIECSNPVIYMEGRFFVGILASWNFVLQKHLG